MIYEDIAEAATFTTARIRRHTVTSSHLARDACWAADDLLRSAAYATGNRHLHQAADAYDRAARAPHGRIPLSHPSGARLRAAARLIAITKHGNDTALPLIAVVAAALLILKEARRTQVVVAGLAGTSEECLS